MRCYRLYVGYGLQGLPANLTLQHEESYPDDDNARQNLMSKVWHLFKHSYAVSVGMTRVEADGKETLIA